MKDHAGRFWIGGLRGYGGNLGEYETRAQGMLSKERTSLPKLGCYHSVLLGGTGTGK